MWSSPIQSGDTKRSPPVLDQRDAEGVGIHITSSNCENRYSRREESRRNCDEQLREALETDVLQRGYINVRPYCACCRLPGGGNGETLVLEIGSNWRRFTGNPRYISGTVVRVAPQSTQREQGRLSAALCFKPGVAPRIAETSQGKANLCLCCQRKQVDASP
jgi:hypothetical protein